jgi:transcriptional regulator with XRE-family HTH domain
MSRSKQGVDGAFGLVVQQHRTTLGFSQEELAERSGLHRTYISQIERGLKSPSLRTIASLAKALGVPLTVLIEETSNRMS